MTLKRLSKIEQERAEALLEPLVTDNSCVMVLSDGSVTISGDISYQDLPAFAAALRRIYALEEGDDIVGPPIVTRRCDTCEREQPSQLVGSACTFANCDGTIQEVTR